MLRASVETLYGGIGLNYGYVGEYSSATVLAELTELRPYFSRLRVVLPDYTSNEEITKNRAIRVSAKNLGFYVIGGVSSNPTKITSANWDTFATAVLAEATWANGKIDEFQIGNEEDLHHDGSITTDQVRTNLKALATRVKAIFSGVVSYSAGWWEAAAWSMLGIGDIDKIGFTLYENRADFIEKCADIFDKFGSNGYLSEWNMRSPLSSYGHNDDVRYIGLKKRIGIIKNSGIPTAYYFLYRDSDGGWGIKMVSMDKYYHSFNALISPRKIIL